MLPACLPIPPSLHVEALLLGDDGLTILTAAQSETERRPRCDRPTGAWFVIALHSTALGPAGGERGFGSGDESNVDRCCRC